jgi:hypothetical protein
MNTLYIKDGVIKTRQNIILNYRNKQIFNPSEEHLLENGWIRYEEPKSDKIEEYKRNLIEEALRYESSEDVKNIFIGEFDGWLDKSERAGITLRLDAESSKGLKDTIIWFGDNEVKMSIKDAISMMYDIEIYSSLCYDTVKRHIKNINKLTTIEELENYDFRSGYPEKISFNN